MGNRVLVAMSGGVDSSFAAALLLDQGFSVEGLTMKLSAGVCCDIASAQQVCRRLGIAHHILDLQAEFERQVVRDFIDEYRAGRTPNPCIRCNDIIKFQVLLSYARQNGFDHLATGHYARIERDSTTNRELLKMGVDHAKDQSYFLYRLTREQLSGLLFPLGVLHKSEVRRQARQRKLAAAERPESQEICFVPDDDYRAFLKRHAPEVLHQGEIVLVDGSVVGRHEGIAFYTVGQRRGLGVAAADRLYVVRIDPDTNRVVLGQRRHLETSRCFLTSLHFHPFDRLPSAMTVDVKVRYRAKAVRATVAPAEAGRVEVRFVTPVEGVTPGQAAVLYAGDVVVGGGIIERSP
jgi:tRNA-specific 2-thiouridylase